MGSSQPRDWTQVSHTACAGGGGVGEARVRKPGGTERADVEGAAKSLHFGESEDYFERISEKHFRGVLGKILEYIPLKKTKDLHAQGFCNQISVVIE